MAITRKQHRWRDLPQIASTGHLKLCVAKDDPLANPNSSWGPPETMTVRAALAPHREGITVAEAAAIIGCDKSTVRELVRIGQLQGWKVGKHRKGKEPTAVRVSSESCYAYRERNTICDSHARAEPTKPRPRAPRSTAVLEETLASLRAKGFRV